jgi:beta-mannosidase
MLINLNKGWELASYPLEYKKEMVQEVLKNKEGWLKADLPCDVHMPLIENNIIPEPLEADNCYQCKWVEDKSWWFKKEFHVEKELMMGDVIELTLESLDSEADVFLNGIHIGHQKSAFYPFSKDVKACLEYGKNVLLIRLTSGLEHFTEQDFASYKKNIGVEHDRGYPDRGDFRRIFVRKPQYVYGWDWGPRVASCGIVKSVWLESLSRIAVRSVHSVTKSVSPKAELEFEAEIENLYGFSTIDAIVQLEIIFGGETVFETKEDHLLRSGLNHINLAAVIERPRLWWPNGTGEQPLYTARVSVISGEYSVSYPEFKFGIRTVRLNTDKINDDERLFSFEINGVRIFCKGANWIPADSIYARVSDEKYEILIKEAAEANFNMLRVWGGGLYERDIFYQKCDEYGIMLWHDFMFGCAEYPDTQEWFKEEVEKEIFYQTRKLRNHASLVLWCGNNENQWVACGQAEAVQTGSGLPNQGNPYPDYYGGLTIYNKLAPAIVRRNCPEIPYWNSSPYGGIHPNANNIGDRHHWFDCMMNDDMEKRITPEGYDKVSSKFISEYGYVGPCRKSSIIRYHGERELNRNSRIWQLHNNAFEKDTVAACIAKQYTDPEKLDIDQYLLYAGLCQGLMYGYSLEAIRSKENCWGSLFWMYDDCWGEVGWTIIDYYLKRKISYYYVKRAFAPVKLILREKDGYVKVFGINDTSEAVSADVEYGSSAFDGSRKNSLNRTVVLKPYSRDVIFEFKNSNNDFRENIIFVKPSEISGILPAVLRQGCFRELILPKSRPEIFEMQKTGADLTFKIKSDCYVHGVHFDLDDEIRLSDEYFDLLPGEIRKIKVFDLKDDFPVDIIQAHII